MVGVLQSDCFGLDGWSLIRVLIGRQDNAFHDLTQGQWLVDMTNVLS